jgi:hypothetical protein
MNPSVPAALSLRIPRGLMTGAETIGNQVADMLRNCYGVPPPVGALLRPSKDVLDSVASSNAAGV